METLAQLNNHPRERDLIGQIILAYAVFEVTLMETVAAVIRTDRYTATRVLYRLRSENNRLEITDALARPQFAEVGLEGLWNDAYVALKFCKKVRNAYAHSTWISDENGVLRFGDLENAAASKSGPSSIRFRPLNLATLEQQALYFDYCHHALFWALDQFHISTGQSRKVPNGLEVIRPKRINQPKEDSRGASKKG